MYPNHDPQAFYSRFQVTSGQITSLPGHFQSCAVTSHHFLSRHFHLLRVTALLELKCTQKRDLQAFNSLFQATFCQMTSLPRHFQSREVV